jgi:hypothetical protein
MLRRFILFPFDCAQDDRAQRVRLTCANVDDDRAGKKAPVHQDGNARR